MPAVPKDLPAKYLALADETGVDIRNQVDLERVTGLATSSLTNFLNGKTRNPTNETWAAVSRAFKVSVDRLRSIRDDEPEGESMTLPEGAHLLNPEQRRLVSKVIEELVEKQRLTLELARQKSGGLRDSAGDDAKARARDAEFGDAADSFERDTKQRRNGDSSTGSS
ncbi:helix-turn-helix domain-containing protein [Tsukamurella sp. USMM236]|uniref:helix-turn-helix domain-containing protein n=1 Tax=Tsukamurella sp. USMM236 TaxID=3081301 RepID=UPI003016A222